jgi:hypothetical protein
MIWICTYTLPWVVYRNHRFRDMSEPSTLTWFLSYRFNISNLILLLLVFCNNWLIMYTKDSSHTRNSNLQTILHLCILFYMKQISSLIQKLLLHINPSLMIGQVLITFILKSLLWLESSQTHGLLDYGLLFSYLGVTIVLLVEVLLQMLLGVCDWFEMFVLFKVFGELKNADFEF